MLMLVEINYSQHPCIINISIIYAVARLQLDDIYTAILSFLLTFVNVFVIKSCLRST